MKYIFAVVVVVMLNSCASSNPATEIPEPVRQGVYAADDAAHAGRYDQVTAYLDPLLRIIPAPKVRLHFTPALRKADKTPVAILPVDAPNIALPVNVAQLDGDLDTPGLVAEKAQETAFNKTVDTQQQTDAKQASNDHAQVQKDKVTIANASGDKWRWAVYSPFILFGMASLAYVAWKLKWL